MQPFLRSFLAGVLAATALGLGLLATLAVLSFGEEALFDALLAPGSVVAFLVGTPLTAALVGLAVARHAAGRLGALGAGILAGVVGQFILLVFLVVAIAVASTGVTGGLVPPADDGVSAGEFTIALLTLAPAGLTAGLVALAAAGAPATDPFALPARHRRDDAADLYDASPDAGPDADLAPDADAPASARPAPAPRQLTCPRCHAVNKVPPGGGRITCKECGLVGRTA